MSFQVLRTEVSDGDLLSYKDYERSKKSEREETLMYGITEDAEFTVSVFGRAEDGRDVCCHVTGFVPYHQIRISDDLDDREAEELGKNLLIRLHKSLYAENHETKELQCFKDFVWVSPQPFHIKSNYGFKNGKTDLLLRVYCKNLFSYNRIKYKLLEHENDFNYEVVDKIEPIIRFFGNRSLNPCGWFRITANDVENSFSHAQQTYCDIEYSIDYEAFAANQMDKGREMNSKFIQMALDIETYTKDRKKGGIDPTNIDNPCFCVGVTLCQNGNFIKAATFYTGECDDFDLSEQQADLKEEPELYKFEKSLSGEKEMLEAVGRYIMRIRPDIIIGYNSDSFDFYYMFERAYLIGCSADFFNMSKIKDFECYYAKEKFSSSARGDSEFNRPDIPGIFLLDAYIVVQSDVTKKFPSYTLRYVAQELVGETKLDLDYEEMFELYEKNHSTGAAEIAKYCIQDVFVTQKVVDVDVMVNKLIEMSNLLYVDILWLITKGQTVKCVSSLYAKYQLPQFNYYFDNIFDPAEVLGGGHVEEPKRGYYKDPTVVLDFKSLYPSIMIARQMDFSSVVLDEKYLNLPGVEYYTSDSVHPVTGERLVATFAKKTCSREENDCLHVIPELLKELSDQRQKIKKDMKKLDEKSPAYISLDSKQNAIKVSMNSFFGFVGAKKYPLAAFAQSITGDGRNMLAASKRVVETSLPSHIMKIIPNPPVVVYGDTDSIFVNLPGATEKQAADFGTAAADYLTEHTFNKHPIEMEYEKTLLNLILLNRKNYVYTIRNKKKGRVDIIYYGGEKVKRDYCDYFHNVYERVCEHVFFGDKNSLTDGYREKYANDIVTHTRNIQLPYQESEELTYVDYVKLEKKNRDDVIDILRAISNKTVNDNVDDIKASNEHGYSGKEIISTMLRYKLDYLKLRSAVTVGKGDKETTARVDYAKDILKAHIQAMLDGEINLAELCETRRLAATYKSSTLLNAYGDKASVSPYDPRDEVIPNIPAVKLARRIKARTPGQEPSIGMRFSFLKTLEFTREDKKADQVELLAYVQKNKVPIDYISYLAKDCKPFQKLFAVLGAGFKCGRMLDAFTEQETKRINEVVRNLQIESSQKAKMDFFKKEKSTEVKKILFTQRKNTKTASSKDAAKAKNARLDSFFFKK